MQERFKLVFYGLVVAVFGLAAAGLIGWLGRTYVLHASSARWQQVPARVLDWDLRRGASQTAGESRLRVTYRYAFAGNEYTGTRADFSLGADNFSGARRRRQADALRSGRIQVHVNPANPAESVMDRSLPVQQVAFFTIFLFFPCGLGTAFAVGSLLKLAHKLSGAETDRWYFPGMGVVHGLPALYPVVFASSELSLFSGLALIPFLLLLIYSCAEVVWRLRDPARGRTVLPEPKRAKPIHASR